MQNNKNFSELLKKLSPVFKGTIYTIPEPKLSPEGRKQRRLAFRNENNLYKRKSSLSGENIISFFNPESPFVVYTRDEWWSDKWDPLDFGIDFNFEKGFFEQFFQLMLKVPRAPLINNKAENSPYCNFADGNNNCHMVTSANWNEDSYFCFCLVDCKDAVDCTWCTDSEIMYECTDCRNCYNLKFSEHCNNCIESAFLYDCIGTNSSIFCTGLRNEKHYIFNKPVSREQFKKTYDYYFFGSYKQLEEGKKLYNDFLSKTKNLRKEFFISSETVSGSNIYNSKNIFEGNDVFDSQDCYFLHDGLRAKDSASVCFFDGIELCYESTSLRGYGYRFTNFCRDSANLFYCDSCYSCKDCFGCVGLRNKQYCILNRQYKKEEYEDLISRIIIKMHQLGEYGEFFPLKYSLFNYNETLAGEYFPLTHEAQAKCVISKSVFAKAKTPLPEKKDAKDYQKSNVKMPDSIKEVDEKFCDEILACEISGKNYRIASAELKFYKKLLLPIPRKCPDQRSKERLLRRKK